MSSPGNLPDHSLLRLLPVRHALEDPYFLVICRPIDCRWNYGGFTDVMGGYNPLVHTHFYPKTSVLKRWLRDPVHSGRELNAGDRLVKEALHMAHDYLHSWAYRVIEHLAPGSRVGTVPVTAENLDHFTFIHLLTEAAAVVGLDYWYLCVKTVSRRCDLGSLVGPRTVEYQEQHLSEYRRFNADLVVQSPDFFFRIVNLFCTDEFDGFDLRDLQKSPMLSRWLTREVQAAYSQRFVTRLWLTRIGGLRVSDRNMRRPLQSLRRDQCDLANELGNLLWRKIKHNASQCFPPRRSDNAWTYPPSERWDFRISNLQRIDMAESYDWSKSSNPDQNFSLYMQQHLSQFRYPIESPAARIRWGRQLATIRSTFDQSRLLELTSRLTRVGSRQSDPAPLEMIFLN
jgi:hypothetical protein